MCGIVSIAYHNDNPDLGKEAAALLRRLEYRGYDSTGASFINGAGEISLMKKVGAPSRVCKELGIEAWRGRRFIGQVRWATYGAVTDVNSQPHKVRCKVEMVGAHNGNISNTDVLKTWLTSHGHAVVSDNDGEIVVHLVEEAYAASLQNPAPVLQDMRKAYAASGLKTGLPDGVLLMIDAIRKAEARAEGSYAAAVADPRVEGVFAIKSGSSLYAGSGSDPGGDFIVVSSDLTSVLSKTRALIPLAEGEGIWFTDRDYLVFTLAGEPSFSKPKLKRSKLGVQDTALDPRFRHYMAQEIAASPANIDSILRYYFKDPAAEPLAAILEEKRDSAKEVSERLAAFGDRFGEAELASGLSGLLASPEWTEVSGRLKAAGIGPEAWGALGRFGPAGAYVSDEAHLLAELERMTPERAKELALCDAIFVWRKRRAVLRYRNELSAAIAEAAKSGGRVFLLASGTSHHASLVAATFFDRLAGVPVYPCNPGSFRAQYESSLTPRDFILGISQSGETKDLVDVFQEVRDQVPALRRACLVNNENSRIPQELSDFYLPLLCGPEVAVAATKSFVSQLAVLYATAAGITMPEAEVAARLAEARDLIGKTLETTGAEIEEAARALFLRPSMHVLAAGQIGLAKEGALKVREVVLNHAEGYDAAEFKHGPNTILGKNTLFSLDDVAAFLGAYQKAAAADGKLCDLAPLEVMKSRPELVEGIFRDYPLVFVCPPDPREVRITVSQIHTHKIRGADIVVIAERSQELALAAGGMPAGRDKYWSKYIELPASGDPCLFVFSAAAALQTLAYRMSELKMEWLDSLGVAEHGVHPDAPKNVSKSITVD
jgi:glucosamine 6-phosphate synthetase-like amidotransferase/phosphosugar isomerase protein